MVINVNYDTGDGVGGSDIIMVINVNYCAGDGVGGSASGPDGGGAHA